MIALQFDFIQAKLWDKVTVVLHSEFGRSIPPNASGGTDHGWGGNYFLFGGEVKGGKVLGHHPGKLYAMRCDTYVVWLALIHFGSGIFHAIKRATRQRTPTTQAKGHGSPQHQMKRCGMGLLNGSALAKQKKKLCLMCFPILTISDVTYTRQKISLMEVPAVSLGAEVI